MQKKNEEARRAQELSLASVIYSSSTEGRADTHANRMFHGSSQIKSIARDDGPSMLPTWACWIKFDHYFLLYKPPFVLGFDLSNPWFCSSKSELVGGEML